jgi:hypothetical protein
LSDVASRERIESTLLQARLIAGGMGAGVLLLALVAGWLDLRAGLHVLTAPAALLGLTAPVVGYRIFLWQRDRSATGTGADDRCARFLKATVMALAVSEGIATFGLVAFMLGAGPFALVGVLGHLLLSGALWPNEEKLALFLQRGSADPPAR